jgi:cytoplasmic iron level regulating protein YaaA (DUF328/UPF0246 family)
MLTLLSPAKTMDFSPTSLPIQSTAPEFIQQSLYLIRQAKQWSAEDISKIMGISKPLGQLNFERFQSFSTLSTEKNSKPAILAYNGDAYQGLNAKNMSLQALEYSQEHLRIFSGLYGILRPFDLIQPYRLEMGVKLKAGNAPDLYHFWQDIVTQSIEDQLNALHTDIIINLASVEYFKTLDLKKLDVRVITPSFYSMSNGKYKMVSFWAKKARGMMTRFIMNHEISNPDDLMGFDEKYCYKQSAGSSIEDKPLFISSEF